MHRRLFAKALLIALAVGSAAGCSESTAPGPNEVAAVSIFTLTTNVVVGGTLQLQGRAVNYQAVRIDNQVTFTWTTSNSAIATVSSTGLVTGVAAGSATITASASGFFDTAIINVTGAPPGGT